MSDSQISSDTDLHKGIVENNMIGFPNPDPLPGDDTDTSYFILGDDIFTM